MTAPGSVAPRAATATAVRLRLRLVDFQSAAFEILAVKGLHGARRIRVRHLDEAKTTGAARVAIVDERDGLDRAVRSEERTQRFFGRAEGKIAYE